jgi:putative ABC transport system ATP-binding protein
VAAPLIRVVGLTRDYRNGDTVVRALRGISLDIHEGEFVAVMGPSGSGKSTLMSLLGLLDRPTSGCHLLDARDVGGLDADTAARLRNRAIGFVFQTFNLLARSTALENVELPLIYAGVAKKVRRRRATEALQRVGLDDRMDHWPRQLSGGEQQRVAIARALVGDPRLILADEPTGALDSRTGLEILAFLQSLNRAGRTIVMVTHDTTVARHAARVVSMQDGRVVGDEVVRAPLDARRFSTAGVRSDLEQTDPP